MPDDQIMSADEQRFMAFEGLVQWAQAVVQQAKRVRAAKDRLGSHEIRMSPLAIREAIHDSHAQDHFFVTAAYKLIEYKEWATSFGICANVNFAELDRFLAADIKNLRDMREHTVEYFQGRGHVRKRWTVNTPDFSTDASSVVGTMIGGRLDWVAFADATERLLPALLAEPIPYPRRAA